MRRLARHVCHFPSITLHLTSKKHLPSRPYDKPNHQHNHPHLDISSSCSAPFTRIRKLRRRPATLDHPFPLISTRSRHSTRSRLGHRRERKFALSTPQDSSIDFPLSDPRAPLTSNPWYLNPEREPFRQIPPPSRFTRAPVTLPIRHKLVRSVRLPAPVPVALLGTAP